MNSALIQYTHEIRVGYHQTDGQRRVHHSNYLNYFEDARVEMLRAGGMPYKAIEDSGRLLVVTEMNVRYFAPADFDDLLQVEVVTTEIRKVRLTHHYRVLREQTLLAEADSVIASVDPTGRPKKLPPEILSLASKLGNKAGTL
ncbi:acyl-CoA thioesterase [Roseiconus lacunae]|uniref:Thioesterase family protein n=1 Tax=Roseiconus lacunae TaxID=2605694 RepID=A0ABT7PMR0_9BACT|nr:thioesterase family protein [Roseiconus lacunae]MCD0460642.1 acyl-CoA thioesterase [Roseiconus lacunae]MDM4017803.1 thioesterase family protein [Roseiconus lacunae]WRQ48452.1 thioesterase family protein [Stieleria sp. HD01]